MPTWSAKQLLLARQDHRRHATAQVGHVDSAEAIYRCRISACRQHVGAIDPLAVRAGQHDTGPYRQADIELDMGSELFLRREEDLMPAQ